MKRQKQLFRSKELPHVWVYQDSPIGRSPGNMSFEGKTYQSYNTAIAQIVENKKSQRAFVLNETKYSISTSRHQHRVRMAIPNTAPALHCFDLSMGVQTLPIGLDLISNIEREIVRRIEGLPKRTKSQKFKWQMLDLEMAMGYREQAAKFFSLRRNLKKIDISKYQAAFEKAKLAQVEQEKIREEARQIERARLIPLAAEVVHGWKVNQQGEIDYENDLSLNKAFYLFYQNGHGNVGLRIVEKEGDTPILESTLGIRVAITPSIKLDLLDVWGFILECRKTKTPKQLPPQGYAIGQWKIESIGMAGNIRAGCHLIAFNEIAEIAEKLGFEKEVL